MRLLLTASCSRRGARAWSRSTTASTATPRRSRFFAMLSFVPLALLLVAAFGLVFDDAEVRERVVQTVFENVPLSRRPTASGSSARSATRWRAPGGSGLSRSCS